MLVDSVEEGDPFEREYAPWPIRFYVLMRDEDGDVRVKLKGMPHGATYDVSEVRSFLLEVCASTKEDVVDMT